MLPRRLRLRKSTDFVSVVRSGRKVARPTLVLYASASDEARFGVIVGRNIGGAVERNRVKRRLRHGAVGLIEETRPMAVVVRALPRAGSPAGDLTGDLVSAWGVAREGVGA